MLQFVFLPLVYCPFDDDDDDVKDVCTVLLHSYDNNHGFCTDITTLSLSPSLFGRGALYSRSPECFFSKS